MGTPVLISGPEAADRLQIRELVDAYAHCADRRDAKGQISLFTKDTHFVVFMDARSEKPSMELNRREDLAPVFDELNKYEATTHFMGQSTVVLDGDRTHRAKVEGKWLFAERKIMVDWTDTRPINV